MDKATAFEAEDWKFESSWEYLENRNPIYQVMTITGSLIIIDREFSNIEELCCHS